jgi:chromosome segregation ATPase
VRAEKEAASADLVAARQEVDEGRRALQEAQSRVNSLEETNSKLEDARKEHDETKNLLEIAIATHAALTSELADTKDRHTASVRELEQARSTAGGNDEMLQRLRADIDVAQNKANELKAAKVELEAEAVALKDQVLAGEAVQAELKSVKEQLELAKSDKGRLEGQISTLQTSTGETDVIVAKLREEIETAEQSAKQLSSKAEVLQVRLDAAESTVRETTQQLEEERSALQAKAKEVEALRSTIDGASAESAGRIVQLESDLAEATKSLEVERAALATTTLEVDRLHAESQEAATKQDERIAELESAHTEAQAAVEAARKERDDLLVSHSVLETRTRDLQAKIDGLQATTAEDDGRLVQLRTDIDDLTRQLESRTVEVNDLTVRIEEEQHAKNAALKETARAAAGLGEAQARLQQAVEREEMVQGLQVELDKLRAAVKLSKDEVAGLAKKLEQAALREAEAAEKAEKAEAAVSALQKERDGAVQERDDLTKRIIDIESKFADETKQSQGVSDKLKALQGDLDAARAAAENAQARERAAGAALETADTQRQAVQAELASARKKMAGLEETIMASEQDDKAARDRLVAAKKDIARLELERDQARTVLKQAESERAAAVERSEQLISSTDTASAQLVKAQSDLSATTSQLAKAEKTAVESATKVKALEQELQHVKDAAAAAAKSTLKRRTSNGGTQHALPSIPASIVGESADAGTAVRALQSKYMAEIGHLEAVIDVQEKTINVQREKIVFWSNVCHLYEAFGADERVGEVE